MPFWLDAYKVHFYCKAMILFVTKWDISGEEHVWQSWTLSRAKPLCSQIFIDTDFCTTVAWWPNSLLWSWFQILSDTSTLDDLAISIRLSAWLERTLSSKMGFMGELPQKSEFFKKIKTAIQFILLLKNIWYYFFYFSVVTLWYKIWVCTL